MKQNLLLSLLLTTWAAQAQTLLQQQSFEGTGTDAAAANAYSSTTVSTGSTNIYFLRSQLPVPGYSKAAGATSTVTGISGTAAAPAGTWFWASESVRRLFPANTVRGNPPANVTLASLNVAGKSSLSVTVALADASGLPGNNGVRWETDDYVRIQYRFNGTGSWNTIGQFVGDGSNGGGPPPSGGLRQDYYPCDGVANAGAPVLNQTLTDYNFTIPGSGNTLEVRVEIDDDGFSEEFGFDNIRVYGASAVGSPPVLGSIESAPVAFAEGGSPVALTSSLTVSDPDSPGLATGTVSISTNFKASEDRLSFVGDATTGNITAGTFNTGTGVLPLTSAGATATPAQWQSAFRRVYYQDVDFTNATAGTRTVSFSVTDPNNNISGAVQRTITVTAALDAASNVPYTEPFETDGEGTRYASNHYFSQDAAQFQRTNANPTTTGPGGTTFSNIAAGTYYWVGVNTAPTSLNPTGKNNGTLTTKQVNAAGYTNLHFQLRIGASAALNNGNQANWTTGDYFQLFYRLNGSSTWTAFGLFRGTTTGTSGGVIRRDASPVGTGVPTGTQLTPALQNFDFALPASLNGQTLDFQLVLVNSDGVNYLAFDQLQVTGTAVTTVNSIVRASASPTNAASVNYTVTFGRPVTGLTAGNFTLTTTGSVSGAIVGTPVSTGTGSTWTVPVTTGTGSGTLTLNLANDTNLSADVTTTLPFVGETYTIDKTAPTVASVTVPANGTYRTGQTLSFTANFSKAVMVTGTPQLALTIGSTTRQANYVSGSGSTALVFSYTIVSDDLDTDGVAINLTNALALNGGTILDAVGNNATLTLNGVPSTAGILVDAVAPTATISSTSGASGGTTTTSPIPFTVMFSESVTGFVAGDVTVTNGTITGGTVNGSGTTYTFTVTPTTAGTATTVNVPANVAVDPAGNGNTGAPAAYAITYSPPVVAPTLTAVAPTPGGLGQAITLTGTGLGSPTALTINGANALAGLVSNSGTSLVVRVPVTAASAGTVSITTAQGTATLPFSVMAPPGNALAFDGVDDYVSGTNAQLPQGNAPRTLEAWVNPANTDCGLFIYGTNATNQRAGLSLVANRLYYAGSNNDLIGNTVLQTGRWYHVAATFDGTTLRLYVNGVLDATQANAYATTGTDWRMGTTNLVGAALSEQFSGRLDEVRVWNVARSAAEVRADLLAAPALPLPAAVVAYYNFDQGTPAGANAGLTTLYDLTSSARPATLNNFALTGSASNYVASYALVVPTATAATSQTSTSFIATWTAPAVGTVTSYLLDVSTTPDFAAPVTGSPFPAAASATSYGVTGLTQNTTYYYRVRALNSALTQPDQGAFSNTSVVATPLPVALVRFTATAEGRSAVRLVWATASERNSARFEVERSLDGTSFQPVGAVAAAGTTVTAHAYALRDAALPTGTSLLYYRLRQVDQDGAAHYSVVRPVALAGATAGLSLYPNPVRSGTVTLLGAVPGTRATVLDAVGRAVFSAPVDATGTATLDLPPGMATGVYLVRAGAQALRLTVE